MQLEVNENWTNGGSTSGLMVKVDNYILNFAQIKFDIQTNTSRLMVKVGNSYLGLRLSCGARAMVGHWKGLGNRLKCELL